MRAAPAAATLEVRSLLEAAFKAFLDRQGWWADTETSYHTVRTWSFEKPSEDGVGFIAQT